jgi:hypothetical protein
MNITLFIFAIISLLLWSVCASPTSYITASSPPTITDDGYGYNADNSILNEPREELTDTDGSSSSSSSGDSDIHSDTDDDDDDDTIPTSARPMNRYQLLRILDYHEKMVRLLQRKKRIAPNQTPLAQQSIDRLLSMVTKNNQRCLNIQYKPIDFELRRICVNGMGKIMKEFEKLSK